MLWVVGTRYNGHFPIAPSKTRDMYNYFTLIEKKALTLMTQIFINSLSKQTQDTRRRLSYKEIKETIYCCCCCLDLNFILPFHPLQRVEAEWKGDFRFGGKSTAASKSFSDSFKKPFVFFCFGYFPGYFRQFF